MTDNIEAALGRGKRGKGFKEVKDKVVNYVKKNKGKLLKATLIGVPVGAAVGAAVGHLLTQGRRREPEPEQFIQPTPIIPFSGKAFRLPLRPGEPARPVEGTGLKERAIKVKDAIVDFIKKNKKIIIAGFMAGALGSVYNNWDEFKKTFSKKTQAELDAELNKIYKQHIPHKYKEDPRRPDPAFVEEIPEGKSGRGFEEIKDKTVQFIKNHKGKLKTAATLGLLALAYNKGDKIMDYIDTTRLGQTETGQKILGNLGYAMGHYDVYKGVLQHLWDKYRAEKFGRGNYILGAGIKDFWKKHGNKIKKAAKLALAIYGIKNTYQNWDKLKSQFKYGKVVYEMAKDIQQEKDLDIEKYVTKLADVFPQQKDKTLENGAVLFQQTLRDGFGRNIQD